MGDDDGMTDDITFCMSDCDCTICYRHRVNIQEPQYPHSYADFKGQGLCPMKSEMGWDRYCDMNGVEEE